MSTTLDQKPGGTISGSRRWWVLAVMSLSTFLVFLDNTGVNVALPSLARDFNASMATLPWVVDG